jgi:hypothetical protein
MSRPSDIHEHEEVIVKLDGRLRRRHVGVLKARLPEVGLDAVGDPRGARGKRWQLASILTGVVAGVIAGCRCLADVEALTEKMATALRGLLDLPRRLPDTTVRDLLPRLAPEDLRECLHAQTRTAHRRKALAPVGLPFGVVAVDGKATAIDVADGEYAQRQTKGKGEAFGLVRTFTAALVSARAKPCIDAIPIPARTNEMGHFQAALDALDEAYGRSELFDLVTVDAGMCSEANASAVRDHGWHYLMGLKLTQPELHREAVRLLGSLPAEAVEESTREMAGGFIVVRRLYRTPEMARYLEWSHLHTVLRVQSLKLDPKTGAVVEEEDRYFVSSLDSTRLTAKQWLLAVRLHWGVENNCHNTWDTAFAEDDRPWITADPRGALNVMLLRRVAYNIMALFRSVTQRSDVRRETPWRNVIRAFYDTLITATDSDIEGLRTRGLAPAAS